MGNQTNREQWAGQERLRFIERQAWWRGTVNRKDLQELFGISAAQASSDLQTYQQLNPTALHYNLRAKRYESRKEMLCLWQVPPLDEAVQWFTQRGEAFSVTTAFSAKVERVQLPTREPDPQIARQIYLAVDRGCRIWVHYLSLQSGTRRRREIAPHAFAHDGYRWHVRAWCFEHEEFRDFVLSRMASTDWPGAQWQPPVEDVAWNSFEELELKANSGLSEERQKAIRYDYAFAGETLRLRVRTALKPYLLAHLRVANEHPFQPHLELRAEGLTS